MSGLIGSSMALDQLKNIIFQSLRQCVVTNIETQPRIWKEENFQGL